ncbi:hypothetical protein MAR_001220 [Mya arenaria]|uniref:Uncharacterized protein n=1 Tax=Mya arenaria TaxID=6604 RepID=A0ABY7FCQ0_MYAAR|nr:hypothetical protein MAR_001220 [Mya arenaria]
MVEWSTSTNDQKSKVENEDKACKSKFLSLLESDLKTIDGAEELLANVHQKYIWYIIDIFILQQNGDGEEIYIDGNASTMLTLGVNGLRKYALYIDKQTRFNTTKCLLLKTNARSPSVDAFILDIDTPVPGYVSTIEGSSKKTTFFYDETDSSKSCHPTTIPDIVIIDQVEIGAIDGLGTGAIVGIAIGSVTGFIALVAVLCWCCRRNKWRYRRP